LFYGVLWSIFVLLSLRVLMVFLLVGYHQAENRYHQDEANTMPKRIPPLSDARVSKAKPADKEFKLSDGGGLHLLVTTTGGKLWRFQYRFNGKQKLLAFGRYPEISLSVARQRREEARAFLALGQDPGEAKKDAKRAAVFNAASSFELVAREWFRKNEPGWSQGHSSTVIRRLQKDVFPAIGNKPVSEIKASDIRSMLLKIEERGATETAVRIKIICGQVFRYAVAIGRLEHDPSAAIKPREIFMKREARHLAAIIDPKALAPLLSAIDGYQGTLVVKSALRLAPLLFVRPGELRGMEWKEVDFGEALWSIPAERMKMNQPHLVPLSSQALQILQELWSFTGAGKFVFPGRTSARPMSNNSVTAALRYLGYTGDTVTGHGFRATARTMLDEVLGFRVDLIEHQLAHAVRDTNGRAYNRTSFLDDRRVMMQKWSDYLDSLKDGAQIIHLYKKAAH
jgi:integrase